MTSGTLIVLSAPSGSGKTTIAKSILEKYPALLFSVSATTRPRREGEVNGKDYFFLPKEEFQKKIRDGALVEWEEIYGNFYGTLKSEIDRVLREGKAMLFDVDVKGALSIKRAYPQAMLIFIQPPTLDALKSRLVNRKTEDAATIKRRLDRAQMELEMGKQFDFRVINDRLPVAIADVDAIVRPHLKNQSSVMS